MLGRGYSAARVQKGPGVRRRFLTAFGMTDDVRNDRMPPLAGKRGRWRRRSTAGIAAAACPWQVVGMAFHIRI